MRLPALAVLLAAVLAAAISMQSSNAAPTGTPALRLLGLNPLVVRGFQFVSEERVRVTATGDGRKAVRKTTAATDGRFTLRFTGVRISGCGTGLFVRAVGSRGSIAVVKLPPRECPDVDP